MAGNRSIMASEITKYLNTDFTGRDVSICEVVSYVNFRPNTLTFAKTFREDILNRIKDVEGGIVICAPQYKDHLNGTYIISQNARLDFLRIVKNYFSPETPRGISEFAIIDKTAKIGKNAYIGPYSYIGPGVVIGDECNIHNNVVIAGMTKIGNRCTIKSNSVIGEAGFGFEYNEFGKPEHFPHIGGVVIGDNVWIGACSTIERAAIDNTIVGNDVKIDDKVQVGHNSVVHDNTLLMAGSVLCGGCVVGRNCWIAPNTVIKEKVKVGENVYTGLGTVIIDDVQNNVVVAGVPAKVIKSR